jgi:16S rRNA (adenine1518-N6/adenine1519-N6)-dimethyltransferase
MQKRSSRCSLTPCLRVIEADFLKTDLSELHALLGGGEFIVAGNLPYYITTPCVLKLLSSWPPHPRAVAYAAAGGGGAVFRAPGGPRLRPVDRARRLRVRRSGGAAPLTRRNTIRTRDVHSAVVLLTQSSSAPPNGFLPFLQAAFTMRRKTLVNNLLGYGVPRERALSALCALAIPTAHAPRRSRRNAAGVVSGDW